jgi:hypothetical protein
VKTASGSSETNLLLKTRFQRCNSGVAERDRIPLPPPNKMPRYIRGILLGWML